MWKYQASELGQRLCILANTTDAAAINAGRDRPIFYGAYHQEALIAVHQAGIKEENERLNTQIKTAIAERVSQGPSLDQLRVEELKLAQAQQELAMCKQARAKLRDELVKQQANNHQRNLELDALHLVWCSGGCAEGVHRFGGSPEDVTLEVVKTVEAQAQRLRQWYENAHARDDFYTKDCEHCGHDVESHGHPFKGSSQTSECSKCSCARYVLE